MSLTTLSRKARIAIAATVATATLGTGGALVATQAQAAPAYGCSVTTTARVGINYRNATATKSVQCILNARQHAGLAVDGIFGWRTEAAVKTFQRNHGLVADGIVGPKTWAKLTAGSPKPTRPTKPQPASSARTKAAAFAKAQVGKPYVWGATGPRAYDCSGLAYASMRAGGLNVNRLTASGYGHNAPRHVSRAQLQPGDLIVANNGTHIAVYVGNGEMVHAVNPSMGVRRERLDGSWFQRQGVYFVTYFR